MNHAVNGISRKQLLHAGVVADIRLLKDVVRRVGNVAQLLCVTRVAQFVDVDGAVLGVAGEETPYRTQADELGSSGVENAAF